MKKQFIKIQEKRYRLSLIKRYETCEHPNMDKKFGIIICFSALRTMDRTVHMFNSKNDRDETLLKLDLIFNCE